MAATRIHDLAAIIEDLDAAGRLARVKSEVDGRHELAGIAKALEGGPRAVLFEKVKGQRWPVFAGLYWNRGLVADLFGRDEAALAQYVADCIARSRREPVDPVVVATGPVLDVTEKDVDLGRIPVPVHALKDGGPYFDSAVIIAKDPETSVRNASIQRFQVANRDTLHVNIDAGRCLETYLEKARRLGRSLWITLNSGVGPGLHFAASAPAEAAPIERDELGIASAFEGSLLALVPGTESDVEMAAHAMWALECEIMPGETAPEGPFAEATNYYAGVAPRPVVHVRRVHRREQPVFQTILPGMEVWNSVGLLGEANVLALLQQQVPGVIDVYFTHGGAGFYHAVVQIDQKRTGWSKQAILAAFAAFPPLKLVTVVDGDVDIRKAEDVEWAMATRFDPAKGIVRIENAFGHGLDPSFSDSVGAKIGFDATQPCPKRPEYERVAFKAVALEKHQIVELSVKAAARPAPAAPVPEAKAPKQIPGAARPGDYDTDRIWQRELADWKKGGKVEDNTPAKPATGTDWDENRWLKRELEAMKREGSAKPGPAPQAPPPKAHPIAPGSVQARPPKEAATAPRASSDWDENRWWQREMAEVKGGQTNRGAPPPMLAPRTAAPARAATTPTKPKSEPPRASEHASDDDEGGFFRSGTA